MAISLGFCEGAAAAAAAHRESQRENGGGDWCSRQMGRHGGNCGELVWRRRACLFNRCQPRNPHSTPLPGRGAQIRCEDLPLSPGRGGPRGEEPRSCLLNKSAARAVRRWVYDRLRRRSSARPRPAMRPRPSGEGAGVATRQPQPPSSVPPLVDDPPAPLVVVIPPSGVSTVGEASPAGSEPCGAPR